MDVPTESTAMEKQKEKSHQAPPEVGCAPGDVLEVQSQQCESCLVLPVPERCSPAMLSDTMISITSLQVLFCLFSCSHQLKISSDKTLQKGSSQAINLKCEAESSEPTDYGIYWFRHKKGDVNPESILYLRNLGKSIYRNDRDSARFTATSSGSLFNLAIKGFDQADQGTYYCLINKNSVLYISPGVPLIYPEGKEEVKDPDPLGLSCDLYVWAPLTVLCGFFLICFLFTSIILCC
ncbi:hypothetical protein GDO81_021060, partial [Engystomops pustulosus]